MEQAKTLTRNVWCTPVRVRETLGPQRLSSANYSRSCAKKLKSGMTGVKVEQT